MKQNFIPAALILIASCSSVSAPDGCARADAVALEGGSCLVFEDNGQLAQHRVVIEQRARETLALVRPLLPINNVRIRIGAGTAYVIPELGFGGRTNGRDEVHLVFNPSSARLPQSLSTDLTPLLAHELHHVARHRTAGFSSNLLEAMIMEGLADQFSIEVARSTPPLWSAALAGSALDTWLERSREQWYSQSYNHDSWFFGSTAEIPRWAGYAIGFELTRRYISANPARKASNLYGELAARFVQ